MSYILHIVLDGLIPYDGTIQYEQSTVNIAITIVCSVLATAGLTCAIVCIIFNFVFRKRKQVFFVISVTVCSYFIYYNVI